MIKNIIFDWSGVITDQLPVLHCIVNIIFRKFGVKEITIAELRKEWEQPYIIFYNKYIPSLTLEQEKIAYREALLSCPQQKLYSRIEETLKNFKQVGFNMVVISSDPREFLLAEIKKFDLGNLFIDIITDAHDKSEVLEDVIKNNKFKPEETLIIGDSTHEIEAGKRVNLKTAAVTWGIQAEDKLKTSNPDFLIHNVKELEQIIFNKSIF